MDEYAPANMKHIGAGTFVSADGTEIHFFPANFCIDVGIPVTEENMRIARAAAEEGFVKMFPQAMVIDFTKAGNA